MHKIIYLPPAESHLLETLSNIAYTLEAPKVACELLAAFDKTVQQISEFPCAFEHYHANRPMKGEIRKVPVKSYVLLLRSLLGSH